MKLHINRWWQNRLVFMTERKKIHQNFLASKYDVKQPSEATEGQYKSSRTFYFFFYWTIYHGYWKCKVWNIFTFYLNLNIHFFSFSRRLFAEHHTVSFWCRIFSSRPKSRKNSDFIDFKAFVYFCHSEGSDKDEITFKMVEKHRYGLWKTVSKHVKGNWKL